MNATFMDHIDLIAKYNRPGPRYTSYPTAVQFSEELGERDFSARLQSERFSNGLSLYFHLPFCHRLCWYCGCNSVVEGNALRMMPYVDALKQEMIQTKALLKTDPSVYQLHFGGGTPNQLPADTLRELVHTIRDVFHIAPEAEVSIELDPRRLSDQHIACLIESGFNRLSMGVQDFNPDVQAAINRVQPFELVADRVAALRGAGFGNLNLDLIYGLPKQNPKSFAASVEAVIDLQPERIALFNYAHVPWLKPHMALIKSSDLPVPRDKFTMLTNTAEQLENAGYVYIGMDHFAKVDDPLAMAMRNNTLHRNFQGYTTRPDLAMLAFGNSAITMLDRLYVQNISDHKQYTHAVEQHQPLKWRGVRLNDGDVMRRAIINHLMCYGEIDPSAIEVTFFVDFDDAFPNARRLLHDMTRDGLLDSMGRHYEVTRVGQFLLRNIAMIFDAYLDADSLETRFSKTI